MIHPLGEQFAILEESRRQLIGRLGSHTQGQLSFKPAPEAWSMLEVVEHLTLVEQGFLRQAAVNFESLPKKMRIHPFVGSVILWFIFTLDLRVKMPVKGLAPKGTFKLDELITHWNEKRAALKDHLETIDAANIRRPMFMHPVSGPLDVIGALRFLRTHFHHHVVQIERIRKAKLFPQT